MRAGDSRAHEAFEFAHRACRGESRFVQVDLVAVLERAQQFDAIERTQAQVALEIVRSSRGPAIAPCMRAISSRDAAVRRGPARGADPRAPLRFDGGANLGELRLSRRGAREIGLGPQEPRTHPLIFRQRFVHARDDPGGVARLLHFPLVAQQQHGAGLGVSSALQAHHHAILYFRLAPQAASRSSG